MLRRGPSERAPEVARLLPGDELAVQGQDPDALRTLPAGWLPVATTESPSRRIQVGFVRVFELTADEPATPLRRATLRKAIGADLDGLESREAAFAALRDQAIRWRGLPDGGPEGDRLARRLADYMATEITPRALEAIDRLSQLRGTGDPGAEALARRLDKISRSFRP